MKNKILFLFCFITIHFNAIAGNEVGNGGVGFYCSETKKYFLLDFYENSTLKNEFKIESQIGLYSEVIQNRLAVLAKFDSKNAELYSKKFKEIAVNLNFIDNIQLNSTNDSFEIAKPINCELKQFAIQRKSINQEKTEIYLDKKIWNELNELEKAGLIMHEIIYEQFLALGEKNSLKVRKFNALIFSNEINNFTSENYKKFIKELRVALY